MYIPHDVESGHDYDFLFILYKYKVQLQCWLCSLWGRGREQG
jgi:hypothetical protein